MHKFTIHSIEGRYQLGASANCYRYLGWGTMQSALVLVVTLNCRSVVCHNDTEAKFLILIICCRLRPKNSGILDKLCNWGLKLVGFLVMNAANNIRATIFEKHTHTDTQIFCTVGESVHSRVPRKKCAFPLQWFSRTEWKFDTEEWKEFLKDLWVYNQTHWFIWSHFIKRKKAKIRNVLRNWFSDEL